MGVLAYSSSGYNSGQYSITASHVAGSANGSESEANNSIATADAVTLGSAITGQLSATTDVDYYAVAVTAAGTLTLVFDVPTDNSYSDYFKLGLYDASGTLLSLFTTGVDKTYSLGTSAAGTYYVGVSAASKHYWNSDSYRLTVNQSAVVSSIFEKEENNTQSSANPLTLGAALTGQLSATDDVDYYVFNVATGGQVALNLQTPTDSLSSFFTATLFDAQGTLLATNQTGTDSTWTLSVPAAGDYYVAVRQGVFYSSGQYSLTASKVAGVGPVVVAKNETVNSGAPIKAEAFIASVSDSNNAAITHYSFFDEGAGGGYLSLNGSKQASATWVTVSTDDLAQVLYVGGLAAGTEKIDIAIYNGTAWSQYVTANVTTTTANLPVLVPQNQSVNVGSSIEASSLLTSYSDPNGLEISAFQFLDEGSGGGFLARNGVKQSSGVWITVNKADLGQLTYVGGAKSASESIDIKVFNGQSWSDFQIAIVTTKEVLPAVLTLKNQTLDPNGLLNVSALISSISDPNNYSVSSYRFLDVGKDGGYLSLNGNQQSSSTWVTVDSKNLSTLNYVGGSTGGSELIEVEGWNGFVWSDKLSATVITRAPPPANPPIVTVSNQSLNTGASIAAASLIASVVNPDNFAIATYTFRDNGTDGGHFIYDNKKQGSATWITVSATQIEKLLYVGGSTAGSETVDIAVFDDHAWSAVKTATITTTAVVYPAPTLLAQDQTVNTNAKIQAQTLIGSVTEPNGFSITAYGFWDEGAGGGYLSLNGTKQASKTWINVSATDLAKLFYVGGVSAGSEIVDVTASNGQVWSTPVAANVTTAFVTVPIVTALNKTVATDVAILASSLIGTVTAPANLPITAYGFKDDNSSGGFLSLDGIKQAAEAWINVTVDDLPKLRYVGGPYSGSENIFIKAQDSNGWSDYAIATVATQGAAAPNAVIAKLTDAALKANVLPAAKDNAISYTEMLKILTDVEPGGLSASEFADLKTLVGVFNKNDGLAVNSYVYDISQNVVNGDAANKNWTGGALSTEALGNLVIGSSQTQVSRLIQKWFLGADLPQPRFSDVTGTYKEFLQPLFGSSGVPLISDIKQGYLGDCYLLASLIEVANCEPNVIQSMITVNGNGTYGIRFYIQNKPVYVTVNQYFPVHANGMTLGNDSVNLWGSLIEKAYVQLNETPGYLRQTPGNIYNNISGGFADPITEITGRSVTEFWSGKYSLASWLALKSTIVNAIQSGLEVDFGDGMNATHFTLINDKRAFIGSHMFAGIGYNASSGNFILRNPWGVSDGQDHLTEFEASMADLFSEKGALWVANGSLGGMAFSSSFQSADFIPPIIQSITPSTSAINVEIGADIVIIFDESIQRGTGSFVLKTYSGTLISSFDAASSTNIVIAENILTINPSSDLAFSTHYLIQFSAGVVKDLTGNSFSADASYDFTTAAAADTTAPTIITFSPVDEATAVAVGTNIALTYSEAIAKGTGNIVLKTTAGTVVATYDAANSSNLSISGAVLTIDPTDDLSPGTGYKVEFAEGAVKDLAGNSHAGVTNYNFTTTAATAADTSAPTISTFSPADEATGVGIASNIILTFSESIVARSGGTIELMTDYGSGHQSVEVFSLSDATRVTISGNVVTIDPTSALLPSTGYHLGFNSALADTAGNAFSYTHGQYNFTTAAAITAGKTADITAYSWKTHTLLSGVSLSAAGTSHSGTSDASGAASFTAITESSLSLTASRAIPSAEATATSAAVNLQDAIAILKMIVGLEVNGTGKALSPYQALAADYDGNGLVQLTDAIGVLKHVVGLTAPDPTWRFVNELDATVPSKTTLSPGAAQTSITASLSASSPVKLGLVGYLSGDVDGSYAGATGSSSLTKTYFDALVAAHPTELSLAQFGVY